MRDLPRDLARGLTVGEMELVNHCSMLAHAPISSRSMTYADTIFPMFTFISGMGAPSTASSARLVGLGLAYNMIKNPDWSHIRPFGVLQRLGLSHLILALGPRTDSIAGFCFPVGLCAAWIALTIGLSKTPRDPFNPPLNSAQTRIDRLVCSVWDKLEMYRDDYDPEGLLGTLTATISMWFGRWCLSNRLSIEEAIIVGASLSSFGYLFGYAYKRTCPISKPFWTLSFMLMSSGISLLKYTLLKVATPYVPAQLSQVLVEMGQRSLECFFASAILDRFGFHNRITTALKPLGENTAQVVTSVISTGILAIMSKFLISKGWKL